MQPPTMSESVGGVDDVVPVPHLTETASTSRTVLQRENARLVQALDDVRRIALRSRARIETGNLTSAEGAFEEIAMTAGATLNDLQGPRAGRWP